MSVNGVSRPVSTASYDYFGVAAFKISDLGYSAADVDGTEFCFVARGECQSLDALSIRGRLQINIYDNPTQPACCPAFSKPV